MNRDEDLEVQFSPSRWSRRYRAEEIVLKHVEFVTKVSQTNKNNVPCQLDVPYGSTEREKLDIFGTDLPEDSPIFIYIHGGFWQELSKEMSSYVVAPLYKAKFKVIIIGYELCPKVTLLEIIQQIQRSFDKCLEYARLHQSKSVYLAGHSAGAHLIASLFQTHFPSLPLDQQNLLRGVFLISGIYDLVPLTKTYVNDALKLDVKTAKRLSPMLQSHQSDGIVNFFVIVGEYESTVFIQQSQSFYKKLRNAGAKVDLMMINEVDHFDITENLNEENYEIVKLVIALEDYNI